MSDKDITLTLEKREVVGKGLGELRRSGQVPAVIHNHGKDSIVVSGPSVEVLKVYNQAGKHHPITITVGSEKYLTIVKDVDIEPKKNRLRHVVFSAIKQNEKVQTEVPIVIEGDAPAEKTGLMVITQLDHVQLEAFPRDLPDQITVSAESLVEIGDKITVADLQVPSGVTILTEAEHPIATVEETKAQISEEAAEEEEEGTAEGEEAAAEGQAEAKEE